MSLSSGYFISFLVWFKSQDHSHDVAMDADKWRINWKKNMKKMSRNKIYTHSQGKQRQFVTSGQNVYQPTQRAVEIDAWWWSKDQITFFITHHGVYYFEIIIILLYDILSFIYKSRVIWFFFIMARYAYNHHHILLMLHNVMYTFIDVLSKHTLKMSKIEIKEKNSHIGHLFKKINDDDNHR